MYFEYNFFFFAIDPSSLLSICNFFYFSITSIKHFDQPLKITPFIKSIKCSFQNLRYAIHWNKMKVTFKEFAENKFKYTASVKYPKTSILKEIKAILNFYLLQASNQITKLDILAQIVQVFKNMWL